MSGIAVHMAMFAAAAGGLLALALASDKPGGDLLRARATPRLRHGLRLVGWALLALGLGCGIHGWGQGIGWTSWLGGLGLVGAALVFALPRWARAATATAPARPRRPQPPLTVAGPMAPGWRRGVVTAVLLLAPPAFITAVALSPAQPLARSDALHGSVGPWEVTLARMRAPTPQDGAPMQIQLRFCAACDTQIRNARISIGPRPNATAAALLADSQRIRIAEVPAPLAASAQTRLWLSVTDLDGHLHQTSWPLARLIPGSPP